MPADRPDSADLPDSPGVTLDRGCADWQIFQQSAHRVATIRLAGRWRGKGGKVQARLVGQEDNAPVTHFLDWADAEETRPDGTWSAALQDVPAGGLYRLETRLHDNPAGEWSTRGDFRHCLGVGDVWVIAGQSNSAGYGRGPVADPPELGLHLFANAERWALATHPLNESTDTRHPVNREGCNPGHSPYLHFARLLKRALNHPVGLVQTALGGSPLSRWNPAEHVPGGLPGGERADLFENLARCARLAGGAVKGVLWYQGESDATPGLAQTYERRFIDAVSAWREALGNAELAVLTVQLNRFYQPAGEEADRAWSVVREAQRQAPREVANVTVVPALDLPLSDGIHTSPAGNLLLAERLARAALGGIYGKPIDHHAPDLQSAKAGGEGRRVDLVFAPVTGRMDAVDPTAQPFRVEDAEGVVAVERVTYPGGPRARLDLARPLAGAAVVHGAFGANPPSVPMDMERLMPMLGFYGVPIEREG